MSIWSDFLETIKSGEFASGAITEIARTVNPAFNVLQIAEPSRRLASQYIPSDTTLKEVPNQKEEKVEFTPFGIAKAVGKTLIINPLDNLARTSYALGRYPMAAATVPYLYMNPDNPLYEDGIQLSDYDQQNIETMYNASLRQINPGQAAFALKQQVEAYVNKSLGLNYREPMNIFDPVTRDYTFVSGPLKENFEARLFSGGLDTAYTVVTDPFNLIYGAGVGARLAFLGRKGLIQGNAAFQKVMNRPSTAVLRDFVLNRDATAIRNHPFVKGTFDPQATASALSRVENASDFELAMGAILGHNPSIEAIKRSNAEVFMGIEGIRNKTKTLISEVETLRVSGASETVIRNAEEALAVYKQAMNGSIKRFQFLDSLINPESGALYATVRGFQGTPFASIARLQTRQADVRTSTILGGPKDIPNESFMVVRPSPMDEVFAIGTRLSKERPSGMIGVRGFAAADFTNEIQANLNRLAYLEKPDAKVTNAAGEVVDALNYKRDFLNRAISAKTFAERQELVNELNEQTVRVKFIEAGIDPDAKLPIDMAEEVITKRLLYKNRPPETIEEFMYAQMSRKQQRMFLQQATNYFAVYGDEAMPVTSPVLSSQLPNYMPLIDADELGRTLLANKGTITSVLIGRPGQVTSLRGFGESAYNFFDSLWKPAILLRFGYPVRNALEGLAAASTSMEGIWHLYPTDSPIGPAEPMVNFARNRFGDLKSFFQRQYATGKLPDPDLIMELRDAGLAETTGFMKATARRITPRGFAWHIKQTEKEFNAYQQRLIQLEEKVKEIDDDMFSNIRTVQDRLTRIFDSKNPIKEMMKYDEYKSQLGKFDLEKVIDDANDTAISLGLTFKEQKKYVLKKRDEYMKQWDEAQETLMRSLRQTFSENEDILAASKNLNTELDGAIEALRKGMLFYGEKLNRLIKIQNQKGTKYNRYSRFNKDLTKIPVFGETVEIPSIFSGEVGEYLKSIASSGVNWRALTTNPGAFDMSTAMFNFTKIRSGQARAVLYPPNYLPKQGEIPLFGVQPRTVPEKSSMGYKGFGMTEPLEVAGPSRKGLPIANTEEDFWFGMSDAAKFFKKDSVGKQLLAGASREDMVKFVLSKDLPESQRAVIAILSGDTYTVPYSITEKSAKRYVDFISDIMERTFPSASARKNISEFDSDIIPPSLMRVWFDYERKNNLLNPVIGSEIELLTPTKLESITKGYQLGVSKAFNFFGTMPEDNWIVNPFLDAVYRKSMIEIMESAIKQGKKLSQKEVEEAVQVSRRVALSSRRKDLYNIIRFTGISAGLGYTVPFVHAIENTFRRWGRLIGRNPQAPRNIGLIWGAPERFGLTEKDERGNTIFTFSYDIKDNPFVPDFVKTAIKNGVSFPQGAINVAIQGDPWLNPGSYPWIQAGANEILNKNPHLDEMFKDKFGIAVPVRWVFDALVQNPEENSWDLIFTPGIKRIRSLVLKEKDDAYARTEIEFLLSEQSEYRAGNRSTYPTQEEIEAKTMGHYMLRASITYGLPVPVRLAPPLNFYTEKARNYRDKYGAEWEAKFYADFPEYYDMVFSILENRTNTPYTTNAIFMLNEYKDLAKLIDSPAGPFNNKSQDYSDLISLITRKWGTTEEYDPHAANYLLREELAGTPLTQSRNKEQVVANNAMRRGWLDWSQYKMWEEEALYKASQASIAAGGKAVTSIRQKNALYVDGNGQVKPISEAKDAFLAAQADPRTGNDIWLRNYKQYDAEGWSYSVRVLKMLTNHNDYINTSISLRDLPDARKNAMKFVKKNQNNDYWDTAREYLEGREIFVDALLRQEAAGIDGGGNIDSTYNIPLQARYNAWVESLKANGHPGFAETYDRFLSLDKLKPVD